MVSTKTSRKFFVKRLGVVVLCVFRTRTDDIKAHRLTF